MTELDPPEGSWCEDCGWQRTADGCRCRTWAELCAVCDLGLPLVCTCVDPPSTVEADP